MDANLLVAAQLDLGITIQQSGELQTFGAGGAGSDFGIAHGVQLLFLGDLFQSLSDGIYVGDVSFGKAFGIASAVGKIIQKALFLKRFESLSLSQTAITSFPHHAHLTTPIKSSSSLF